MTEPATSGLIAAYALDRQGGGNELDWAGIASAMQQQGDLLWVHLDLEAEDSRAWLEGHSGLDPLVVNSLLAENTRPHVSQIGDGAMLFLRGVNFNPGADPDDMVSIRLWLDRGRIISLRRRRLQSVNDLRESINAGRGPVTTGEFVVELAGHLHSRMSGVIGNIDELVDDLEEQVLQHSSATLRSRLTGVRRDIISLRRYLAPQREALARLSQMRLEWLRQDEILHLREQADVVARYVEDLDAARERASVTHEELGSRLSEQMNARMYVLSVVAAVFLPLGFLTGLLGINVGGIPLADNGWGFALVCAVLVGVLAVQVIIFRWRHWF